TLKARTSTSFPRNGSSAAEQALIFNITDMQKKFFLQWTIPCLMLASLTAGCNKLLDVPGNSAGQLVTSQVFADSANATAGVLGLYTSSSLTAQYPDIYTGLGSDELLSNSASLLTLPFYRDSLFASKLLNIAPPTEYIWGEYYGSNA